MAYKCLCTCHRIPLCKWCNECYLGHGISYRQFKNEQLGGRGSNMAVKKKLAKKKTTKKTGY